MIMEMKPLILAVATYCVALVQSAAVEKRSAGGSSSETAKQAAKNYLEKYGYMGKNTPDDRIAALTDSDPERAMSEALKVFQRMANIDQTGVLDDKTIEWMDKPRCGVPDIKDMSMITKKRRKRYALHSKWGRNSLTWKLTTPGSDLSLDDQKSELRRAFQVWAEHTPLRFRESSTYGDIDIRFARGEHGDGYPFDGQGRTLAHAFFPASGGDAHFDEDENFTKDSRYGTNFFQVAAHEFGHSLGLSHSDVTSALMAPFYRGYQPNFKLDQDDINGIQRLYGSAPSSRTTQAPTPAPTPARRTTDSNSAGTTRRPTAGPNPDYCTDARFDAIAYYRNEIYAFRGDRVMKIGNSGVASGWPQRISQSIFRELPDNLDASLHWPASSSGPARTYFFKGSQYWRYGDNGLVNGYPRQISQGFKGLPNDIDAAFVWGGNGRTYFVKGNQYYRYRRGASIDYGYPRPLSVWKGLPSRIDGSLYYANGYNYFFSGQNYYRFNNQRFQVDSGYPRTISQWWLGCSSSNVVDNSSQSGGQPHDTEQQDMHDQIPVIMPSSNPDVFSGQAQVTLTASLSLAVMLCHVVQWMI